MNKYDHMLFDWDGTLAKTLDIWLEALRSVLEAQGHILSDEQIGANYGTFQKRFEDQVGESVVAILEEASAIAERMRPDGELYPHAVETLQQLHAAGKKLAVVTTSTHAQIDPLLAKHGLRELFDAVICADDTAAIKPDPEPILKVMTILGSQAASTVLIGDSENDLLAAKAAGIDSILFYPASHDTFHNLEYLQSLQPTQVIADLSELIS